MVVSTGAHGTIIGTTQKTANVRLRYRGPVTPFRVWLPLASNVPALDPRWPELRLIDAVKVVALVADEIMAEAGSLAVEVDSLGRVLVWVPGGGSFGEHFRQACGAGGVEPQARRSNQAVAPPAALGVPRGVDFRVLAPADDTKCPPWFSIVEPGDHELGAVARIEDVLIDHPLTHGHCLSDSEAFDEFLKSRLIRDLAWGCVLRTSVLVSGRFAPLFDAKRGLVKAITFPAPDIAHLSWPTIDALRDTEIGRSFRTEAVEAAAALAATTSPPAEVLRDTDYLSDLAAVEERARDPQLSRATTPRRVLLTSYQLTINTGSSAFPTAERELRALVARWDRQVPSSRADSRDEL